MLGIHPFEVDEALKRRLELPRVVIACRSSGAERMKPWIGDSRLEEPAGAGGESDGGAYLIDEAACNIPAYHERAQFATDKVERPAGDALPKRSQSCNALVRRVPGDDCAVDPLSQSTYRA